MSNTITKPGRLYRFVSGPVEGNNTRGSAFVGYTAFTTRTNFEHIKRFIVNKPLHRPNRIRPINNSITEE